MWSEFYKCSLPNRRLHSFTLPQKSTDNLFLLPIMAPKLNGAMRRSVPGEYSIGHRTTGYVDKLFQPGLFGNIIYSSLLPPPSLTVLCGSTFRGSVRGIYPNTQQSAKQLTERKRREQPMVRKEWSIVNDYYQCQRRAGKNNTVLTLLDDCNHPLEKGRSSKRFLVYLVPCWSLTYPYPCCFLISYFPYYPRTFDMIRLIHLFNSSWVPFVLPHYQAINMYRSNPDHQNLLSMTLKK